MPKIVEVDCELDQKSRAPPCQKQASLRNHNYIKGTRAPCASFLMCECACIRVFLFCCCCCAVVLCCCAVVLLFRCAVVPFFAVVLLCSCSVVLCCSVVLLFCCSVLPPKKTQVFAAPAAPMHRYIVQSERFGLFNGRLGS